MPPAALLVVSAHWEERVPTVMTSARPPILYDYYGFPASSYSQLSLKAGLDPAEHLAIGRALAPLRDEGVFLLGSGMSFHNLRAFRDPSATPDAVTFDTWLRDTMSHAPRERDRRLTEWASAPAARRAHPREEHLLPLMVIAGAAGEDRATVGFSGTMSDKRISAFHFG